MEIKEKSYISLLRSNALFFGFTEDEIRKMHMPIIEEKNKHKRPPQTYSSGKIDNTIGAIMRAKGIALAEI